MTRPLMVVLADSLSYYGPEGGLAADDERLWPNIVADSLGLDVELFARIGWTSRDIWWALTQDPRIWAVIPRASVVVLAYGGMDSLPSPVPTALREQIRYIRPPWLRQYVRTSYQWIQPRLSPARWPMALPPQVSVEYLERTRAALDAVRPDLPLIATLPPTHNAVSYGFAHPGRMATTCAVARWAHTHHLPVVDLYPPSRQLFADRVGNPDGIHWDFRCHRDVADLAEARIKQVLGEGVSESGGSR